MTPPTIDALREAPMPDGCRLTVPADGRLMTPFILEEQGDWFEDEIHFVREYLQPGMSAIDVGANYGAYLGAAATAVGPTGKVWGYEPASQPNGCLIRTIAGNGWKHVSLRKTALSDRVGTARLGIESNAELNSLGATGMSGEEVPLSTLDVEMAGFDRPIDFLKLDAEGEECRIVSAATAFFARHDPLTMFELRHGNQFNNGLVEAFTTLGSATYRLIPGLNRLVPHDAGQPADDFMLNAFACGPGRRSRLIERGWLIDPATAPEPPAASDPLGTIGTWCGQRPWEGASGHHGAPKSRANGFDGYAAGMADLIGSERVDASLPERFALLQRAERLLLAAWEQRRSVPRGLTLARVRLSLGRRGAAQQTLHDIGKIFRERKGFQGYRPDEPFMPACRRHDALDPKGEDTGLVIKAMLEEALLENAAFSILFCWPQIAPLLRQITSNPLTTAPMRRRIAAADRWLTTSE